MPAHTQSLAALPRQLRISPSTAITRTHLLALYKEELRVAHSFASYNFKQYFLRRTRHKFRTELPALLDSAYANSSLSSSAASAIASSPSSSASPSTSAASDSSVAAANHTPVASASSSPSPAARTPEDRLREWYAESLSELAVMARSALINSMYEAPKLVVEGKGRIMTTGGGGAGAEASYGGGGQPANPEGTPSSA
ncbi:hypothetical protein JCM10908_005199 [Rhodotorula pacifica]|uniref:Isd11p n=1 Tax=Rhodotorula pacifica TaxID=1495444 RepID=UPI003175D646